MKVKNLLLSIILATFIAGFSLFESSNTNAQNNTTALPLSNSTSNSIGGFTTQENFGLRALWPHPGGQ